MLATCHEGGASSEAVTKIELNKLIYSTRDIESKVQSMKRELAEREEAADDYLVKKMHLSKEVE